MSYNTKFKIGITQIWLLSVEILDFLVFGCHCCMQISERGSVVTLQYQDNFEPKEVKDLKKKKYASMD